MRGNAERVVFLVAAGVIAIHVLDDSFIQPEPGTSAGDHLVSGLVPLAALAVAAVLYPRVRPGARATLAVLIGAFGIVAGIEGWHYSGWLEKVLPPAATREANLSLMKRLAYVQFAVERG